MDKQYWKSIQGLEERSNVKVHFDSIRETHTHTHTYKNQIGKRQAMIVYMDSGLRKSHPPMTDFLSKWIDACKKQT